MNILIQEWISEIFNYLLLCLSLNVLDYFMILLDFWPSPI